MSIIQSKKLYGTTQNLLINLKDQNHVQITVDASYILRHFSRLFYSNFTRSHPSALTGKSIAFFCSNFNYSFAIIVDAH